MTDFLQMLINDGVHIQSEPIHNGWLEFDSPGDYEKAIGWVRNNTVRQFCELE